LLEGVLKNPWFFFVQVVTLAGQIVIIFFGGEAFQTVRLSGAEWGWSMLFGLLTLPVGVAIRLIPDALVHKLSIVSEYCLSIKWPRRPIGDHEQEAVQHRRSVGQRFKAILPSVFASKAPLRDTQSHGADAHINFPLSHQTPQQSAGAVEEFDLAGAVDSARYGTGDPHPAFEVHPDTLKEDPVIQDFASGGNMPPSQNPGLLRYVARFSQ
jgi:Ca2+-transporting ATPase